MSFDPKKHIIRVQGNREYLPVAARLVWFRQEHPDWSIVTSPIEINLEKQYAIFSATIMNAEGKIIATGTKMENIKGFPDYLEKSETGAVGRALAMSGYGTQFAPELEENDRFADSPFGQPANARVPGRTGAGFAGRPGSLRSPIPARSVGEIARPAGRFAEDDALPPVTPQAPSDTGPSRPLPEPAEVHQAQAVPAPSGPVDGSVKAAPSLTRVREPEPDYSDPGGSDEPDSPDEPFDELILAVDKTTFARTASAVESALPASSQKANPLAGNNCSITGCRNVLTPSQMTMTKQKYGRPLCLLHQRDPALTGVTRSDSLL